MHRLRNAALVLLPFVLFALIAGCAGRQPAGDELQAGNELPDWVRVVIPERDGRAFFVGGVSFAVDAATGIAAAEADARSQVHLKATRRFTETFNKAVQGSGVETEPIERMDLKNSITGVYGNRVAEKARQDTFYYRPCGDAGAEASPARSGSGGPVCQVFVLMSVGDDEWDRVLGEVLAVEKRRRVEEGEDNVAAFTEWIMHEVLEEQPEVRPKEARER